MVYRKEYQAEWRKKSKALIAVQNKRHIAKGQALIKAGIKIVALEKQCSKCKHKKIAANFYKSSANKDGLSGWCKACNNAHVVDRGRRLLGVSPSEFKKMMDHQKGLCAICCRTQQQAGKKSLCLDHNHTTGAVRGLLCARCNTMIGNAGDSIDMLEAAIKYLRHHNEIKS